MSETAVQPMTRALAVLLALAAPLSQLACYDQPLDLERMNEQAKVKAYQETPYLKGGHALQPPPTGTVPRSRILTNPALIDGVVAGRMLDKIPVPVTPELLARGQNRFNIYCAPCHGLLGDGVSEVARNMTLRPPPSLVDLVTTWDAPGMQVNPPLPVTPMGAVAPVSNQVPPTPLATAIIPEASEIAGTGLLTEAMGGTPWDPLEPVRLAPPGNRHGPGGIFHTITNGFGLMPSYRAEIRPEDRWAVVAYVRALQLSQRASIDKIPPDQRGNLPPPGQPEPQPAPQEHH